MTMSEAKKDSASMRYAADLVRSCSPLKLMLEYGQPAQKSTPVTHRIDDVSSKGHMLFGNINYKQRGAIMLYVGLDISSKSFQVYALNERKKVKMDSSIEPTKNGLKGLLANLGKEKKYIVFEAGNQLKWIALYLKKKKDVILHVVHPNEVKWIVSSKRKTDKVDAKKLAELARINALPEPVHIVDGDVRKLRELLSARDTLVSKRVGLMNMVRGLLKQEGVRLTARFFSRREWRSELATKAGLGPTQKRIVDSYKDAIDALTKAEKELTESILEIKDDRTELIESVPGIGKLTSRVLVSALDNVDRFRDKKCVANYGALTPTIYQSGDTLNQGPINRDGRWEVRTYLLQCAHRLVCMKSPAAEPFQKFFQKIEKRRGKKKAIVALARKLLVIVYGILKNGCFYEPSLVTLKAA